MLVSPFVAVPAVMFAVGHFDWTTTTLREAGILGGEAILNGLVVEQGMKLIFWRERPTVDGARGRFFQTSVGGTRRFLRLIA